MGPYYRGTSQSMGAFVEMFYQYPILMGVLAAAVAATAWFFWNRSRQEK